uniref:Lipocalin/cytosolic fatty-acid binding domain-containing protein n=1 Tax=Astyanax mexicanus TaxID=7994 RepID=W5LAB0_ASTMX
GGLCGVARWMLWSCLVVHLAGKWYSIRSSSNAPWFVRLKDRLSMEEIIVTPQPSGDILDLIGCVIISEDGSCRKLSDMASKTSIPGRFTFYVESEYLLRAKAEVIEKFKTISEEQGIKSENTAILSKFGTSAIYKYIIYTIQIMQRKQVHIHKVLRVQK